VLAPPAPATSEPEPHPVLERLRDIDLDALAPREALELACRLRKRVE
jgi:hypothetical protein